MDPERLFKDAPPNEPLDTLSAIVRDWKWRFIEGESARFRDEVVEYCREAEDLVEAVERAVLSRRPNGKMHNHQSKVKQDDRLRFGYRIIRKLENDGPPDGFDELYDWLGECKVKGIGPVTHYDVATRVGAYLGLQPLRLYLHAGVLEGWKALDLPVEKRWGGRVPVGEWPKPLQALPADEVEDLLCCYRALLPDVELE